MIMNVKGEHCTCIEPLQLSLSTKYIYYIMLRCC